MESGKVGVGREGCFPSRKSYKWSGVSEQDGQEDVRCDRESVQARASVCVPFQGRETVRGAAGRPPKGQLQRTERRGRHPAPVSVGSRGRVPWPSRLI